MPTRRPRARAAADFDVFGELLGERAQDARDHDLFLRGEEATAAVGDVTQPAGDHVEITDVADTGLDAFEMDVILLCLAPALDLRYERLYAYLQDDVSRKRPTVNLALDLLCEPGVARLKTLERFGENGRLLQHALIERVSDDQGGWPGP